MKVDIKKMKFLFFKLSNIYILKILPQMYIILPVPPRILEFHKDHKLREGSRLTLTCVITEGDLPLKFLWTKDGIPQNNQPHVEIKNWDEFNSHLVISHVMKHHAGNYTCKASNAAASAIGTAALYVNGKRVKIG